MDLQKFHALMTLIIPQVVEAIAASHAWDEITASERFYRSELYALLEDEETKLWHLSPLALRDMFEEEITTGTIVFPEEA